jgi:hypothetical protein
VVVCAGNTSAAQPWRWHKADNMHTTKGQKQGDGKRGSAHDEGLCSPDSWPKKGRAFARRWRAHRVGADSKLKLGVRSSEQRYDTIARQGSARVAVGSGTCKRPARLDDQLSSDGGSARRCGAGQRSSNKQRAHKARSSLGSKAGSTTR